MASSDDPDPDNIISPEDGEQQEINVRDQGTVSMVGVVSPAQILISDPIPRPPSTRRPLNMVPRVARCNFICRVVTNM